MEQVSWDTVLQLEIYKRVVTALLDPLGGGHPWLGWVLGSRAGGQLGTPVGGGRTTQPQEIIRGIPWRYCVFKNVMFWPLFTLGFRIYGFICVLQIMSAVHVCGVCPGAIWQLCSCCGHQCLSGHQSFPWIWGRTAFPFHWVCVLWRDLKMCSF